MIICCAIVNILFTVQYITSPDGNGAKITVKKRGKNIKIFAWTGSGGAGFNFCCIYIDIPIKQGQAPISKKEGGSQGINPKILNIDVGSLSDKSLIQPKKG